MKSEINKTSKNMKIPSTLPYFSQESTEYILKNFRDILEGKSFLTLYKHCEEFEKKFANYVGTKYALTTNSGTSALEAIFQTLDVKGYDVIIPANTFGATAFAAIKAGARPVFADIGNDLTINPEDVVKRITDKTKVIVTVHIGGMVSPNTYDLLELCKKKGIYLVEDVAHAHGSILDRKKAGTFGIASAFSFFSTKVMTTGEGGMVVTNNEKIANKVKIIRDQAKIKKGNYQNYHEELGYNWRMTEVQALMGIAQLDMLEEFIKRRNEIAKIYDSELKDIDKLSILKTPSNVRHNYYKYVMFLNNYDREKLSQELKQKYNISMGGYVYEIPLHQQPVFREYINGNLPVAEDLCSIHICPPIYYTMTNEEVLYVTDSIKEVLK